MDTRLPPLAPRPPALVPPPETAEDALALRLALSLRPQPLPWRPPDEAAQQQPGPRLSA